MILLRSPKRRQATTTQKATNDILKNSYENILISLFKWHFIFYTFKQIQAIKRSKTEKKRGC